MSAPTNVEHDTDSGMHDPSSEAAAILALMEANRAYGAAELQARFPDTSADGLREIMHELWINRCVERFGCTGWRRQVSTCAPKFAPVARSCASGPVARSCGHSIEQTAGEVVRLEQLLDQQDLAEMFK